MDKLTELSLGLKDLDIKLVSLLAIKHLCEFHEDAPEELALLVKKEKLDQIDILKINKLAEEYLCQKET